jgi:hypothetical protein
MKKISDGRKKERRVKQKPVGDGADLRRTFDPNPNFPLQTLQAL